MINMRILKLIKMNLKTVLFYQFWQVLLGFVALPLLLVLFITFIASDDVMQTSTIPEIGIEIIDEDQSGLSNEFIQIFESEQFQITEENPMYRITIPEGYQQAILEKEPITIHVEELENNLAIVQAVMESTIEHYNQLLSESILMQEIPVDMERLAAIYQAQSFEKEIIIPAKTLSPFEENAILFSGFTVMMVAFSITGAKYMIEGTGIDKRMQSVPLTKVQLFHCSIIENYTMSAVILAMSILAFSFFGEHFRTNFLYFIPVIGLLSLLTVSLGQLIGEFCTKMVGRSIFGVAIAADMVVSAVVSSSDIMGNISQYLPTQLIHQLYRGALEGNFENLGMMTLAILGIFLGSYLIIRIKYAVKWGRQ